MQMRDLTRRIRMCQWGKSPVSISGLSVSVRRVCAPLSGIPDCQSACEELIRKQQRPSHINRHECVHVCMCVWVCIRMCVFGEPPWHTYGCLSTNGGIDSEGKADRNEF